MIHDDGRRGGMIRDDGGRGGTIRDDVGRGGMIRDEGGRGGMIRDDGGRGGMIFSVDILAQYKAESRFQQTHRKHIRALRDNGQSRIFLVFLLV